MRIKNVLRSGILNILFQCAFLILMYLIGSKFSLNIVDNLRFLVLVGIVLVPSIIWTIFFYLQDRLEPEPASYLATSFVAGMAAASLGAIPLYYVILRIHEWIYASPLLFVFGAFFLLASIVSILLYLVIRYGFYPLREFDEPVDGMIYGAIAGAGIAFVITLHYLLSHPSYTLFVIAYTASANILVFSGAGSVIGYIMGSAKFQRKNIDIFSLVAVGVGIIILGIYHLVNEFIFISGFSHAFWLSFILTLLYSFLVLAFCYAKMRKLTKKDYHEEIRVTSKFDRFTLFLIVILFLIASIVAYQGLRGKKFVNTDYGISFYYPHSLSSSAFNGIYQSKISFNRSSKILFEGKKSTAPYFTVSVKVYPKKESEKELEILQYLETQDIENLMVKNISLSGKRGQRAIYSYSQQETALKQAFPQLIYAYTDIIPFDETIFTFTYKAPCQCFEDGLRKYQKMITSLKWQGN